MHTFQIQISIWRPRPVLGLESAEPELRVEEEGYPDCHHEILPEVGITSEELLPDGGLTISGATHSSIWQFDQIDNLHKLRGLVLSFLNDNRNLISVAKVMLDNETYPRRFPLAKKTDNAL